MTILSLANERIDRLNEKLKMEYGYFQGSPAPNWRIVWSEDQFEKRYGAFEDRTPEGHLIRRVNEVREVPKYRQWVHNKYILERMLANVSHSGEMILKTTYEPVYVFENPENQPPIWDAIKFIVELVYEQCARAVGIPYVKYAEPEDAEEKRIKAIQDELYGDRTDVSDALAYKEGIVVPSNFGKDKS